MSTEQRVAHVICCNDMVVHVHLGDEAAANNLKEQLARADFERNVFHYDKDYAKYRSRCYWHVHDVGVTG